VFRYLSWEPNFLNSKEYLYRSHYPASSHKIDQPNSLGPKSVPNYPKKADEHQLVRIIGADSIEAHDQLFDRGKDHFQRLDEEYGWNIAEEYF
jgi:hypothetical protein